MRAIAVRRVLALATAAPTNCAQLVEDNLDRSHVRASMRAITIRIRGALLTAAPRVLAGVALINERPLDDASGRLWARVGHPLVLQPPGGLSNSEPLPIETLPSWFLSIWCTQLPMHQPSERT